MLEAIYLDQAIAQNLGDDHPDAWTCIRLATQIYLRDRLYGQPVIQSPPPEPAASAYALADAPEARDEIVAYDGKTEFARAIDGKRAADIWPIMDDMMSMFATLYPDLYDNAIRLLRSK